MKTRALGTIVVLLAMPWLVGCPEETELVGHGVVPGEENVTKKTFNLSLPDVSINQGESQEAAISMDPGEEFDQTVTVTLTPPSGVTVDPTEFELDKDLLEKTFVIQADAAAPAGEHTIQVAGKPETGDSVDGEITLTVEEVETDDPISNDPENPANTTTQPDDDTTSTNNGNTATNEGDLDVVEEEPFDDLPDSLEDEESN